METLVATVLIVVLFMVTSRLLNSLFANSIRQNDTEVRYELRRLQYLYENNKLEVPYVMEKGDWRIEVEEVVWKSTTKIVFSARDQNSNKELVFSSIHE